MKFIFCALVIVLSMKAQAEFKKANCTGIKPEHFSQVYLEAGATCLTALKMQNHLIEIKKFAGFAQPRILFVQKESYESFGTFGGIIVLNQEQQAWDRIRPQEQNEKIWMHELGHIFFTDWLIRDFKPIEGFASYMSESAKLSVSTNNPYADDSLQLAGKWKQDYAQARDIQVPYNELFADLVAVLASNDPMTMTKAMQSPGMPSKVKKETAYYGFTGKYDLTKWNETNSHYYFTPARAFIGQKFLKFPMDNAKKSEVLQKVYKACLNEIKKYWAANKKLPTSAEANQSLIKALESNYLNPDRQF